MPDTMAVNYFAAMTGNDRGRVFSAASVAGKLIGARRLRLNPIAILCAIPVDIVYAGVGLPLRSDVPAPVSVPMNPDPLAEVCGLQAAVYATTGQFVPKGLAPVDVQEGLRLAEGIISELGIGDLKLLTRVLLMPPYTDEGLWGVPNIAALIAADSGPHALVHDCAADAPDATAQPSSAGSQPRKDGSL